MKRLFLFVALSPGACGVESPSTPSPAEVIHDQKVSTPTITFRAVPAIPGVELRGPIHFHVSPSNGRWNVNGAEPLTVGSQLMGSHKITLLSSDYFGETQRVDLQRGTDVDVSFPVIPLQPKCWHAKKSCFIVNAKDADKLLFYYRWGAIERTAPSTSRPYATNVRQHLHQALDTELPTEAPTKSDIATILYTRATSLRRIQWSAKLLTEAGFKKIRIWPDWQPKEPTLHWLQSLPEIEIRYKKRTTELPPEVLESEVDQLSLYLRGCFAQADYGNDWIEATLTVDADGLVSAFSLNPGVRVEPGPQPSEEEQCSEYDEHMSRCVIPDSQRAENQADFIHYTTGPCVVEEFKRFRFPPLSPPADVDRIGYFEFRGRRPAPKPSRPKDELGK